MVTREIGSCKEAFSSMLNNITINSYLQEWEALFNGRYYLEQLKSTGIKGCLRNSHFRSVCWKIFLECLPEDRNLWIDTVKLQRQRYEELLDKFHTNPRTSEESTDINVNNPLSQSQQSPWNQYFQDSELKVTIQQDVVRTFPEIEFFHTPEVQQMMTSILFSYAREYPYVSYKQGMHELLAPIILVLHYDQQAYLQVSEAEHLELDIRIILNQNYIEHDAFFLFCQLMGAVEAWYTMNESPYSKSMSLISAEPFSQSMLNAPVNSLGIKLKRIYENLLKHHDAELFLYLEKMEITPQIFGIRWLRLLFGREFAIHDLLIIWDAIFADSVSFDLVDYIFVGMLISIRDLLLNSDYASCLSHLMHYPNVTDVHYIIDLALYLRDPGGNLRPESSSFQKSLNIKEVSAIAKDSKILSTKANISKKVVQRKYGRSRSKGPCNSHVKSGSVSGSSFSKHSETRPKSLRIAGIGTLSSKESMDKSFSPLSEREKLKQSSTLTERRMSADVIDQNDSSNFDWIMPDKIPLAGENKGISYTLPRAVIRNVMESKNHRFKASELAQNFGRNDDRKWASPGSLYREMFPLEPAASCAADPLSHREMVPLVPPASCAPDSYSQALPTMEHTVKKTQKSFGKDKVEEAKVLRTEISELKAMNDYCAQQITLHIEKLQETMIGQSLLYEDEMFVALAGLKRARDILKGTVPFSEEVVNDDGFDTYASLSKQGLALPRKSNDEITSESICSGLSKSKEWDKNTSYPKSFSESNVDEASVELDVKVTENLNSFRLNTPLQSKHQKCCPQEQNNCSCSLSSNVNGSDQSKS